MSKSYEIYPRSTNKHRPTQIVIPANRPKAQLSFETIFQALGLLKMQKGFC